MTSLAEAMQRLALSEQRKARKASGLVVRRGPQKNPSRVPRSVESRRQAGFTKSFNACMVKRAKFCGKRAVERVGGERVKSPAKVAAARQNPWIAHVKQYAADHGLTYSEALHSPDVRVGYVRRSGVTIPSQMVYQREYNV